MEVEFDDLVKYLDWDSEFFGRRIGRILPGILDAETWQKIRTFQKENRIDCLYFLADGNDYETLQLAKENGFFLADVRVENKKVLDLEEPAPPPFVRSYREGDLAGLRAMARANHHDSRFYTDRHFPTEKCDDLFDIWIHKSCQGYADATFVAELDGKAVGYITVNFEEICGRISLVGIDVNYQGQGLGKALVMAATYAVSQKGYKYLLVVTQGRNIRAQRLYQKSGFYLDSMKLWFHWWDE